MSDNGFSINSLYIEDFMGNKKSEIDFTSFNSALIVGRDKFDERKSNGIGKSTIFHAINYVLFGVVPTKTVDKVVRDDATKCVVIIEFNKCGKDYKIKRQRSLKSKKSEGFLYTWDGEEWKEADHRKNTDTEEEIRGILGINFDAWNNSVLFPQGSFSDLAEGTEATKRQLLKEPLNLGVYSEYEKIIKRKRLVVEKDLERTQTLVVNIGNPDDDIVDLTSKIKVLSKNLKDSNKNREENNQEIDLLRSSISQSEKLLNSDEAKVSNELVSLNKSIESLKKEESSLSKKSVEYTGLIDSSKRSLKNNKEELTELENSLNEIKNIKIKSEDEINQEIKELSDRESKGNKFIAALEFDLDRHSKSLPEGAHCDVCFNELNEEYRLKITEDNSKKAKDINAKLSKAHEKLSGITKDKINLYEELKNISKHQSKIDRISSNVTSKLKEISSSEDILSRYRKMLEQNIESLEGIEKEISTLEKKENTLKSKIKNFDFTKVNNELVILNSEIRNKERKDKELISEISRLSSEKGIAEEKKRLRKDDSVKLKELSEEKKTLERKLRVHNKAVKAFSPSGIPTLIIHTVLDDLQIEANNILQEIRPDISLNFSVERDEKEVLDINYKVNGKERDYMQLSGGQKMYISFALKLGLSIIIQNRMGTRIELLELDEVDQPLDESGRDAFIDIIKKYQSKYKILVVTHNDRLKDKFSHAILVEGDGNNGSTASVVTGW